MCITSFSGFDVSNIFFSPGKGHISVFCCHLYCDTRTGVPSVFKRLLKDCCSGLFLPIQRIDDANQTENLQCPQSASDSPLFFFFFSFTFVVEQPKAA